MDNWWTFFFEFEVRERMDIEEEDFFRSSRVVGVVLATLMADLLRDKRLSQDFLYSLVVEVVTWLFIVELEALVLRTFGGDSSKSMKLMVSNKSWIKEVASSWFEVSGAEKLAGEPRPSLLGELETVVETEEALLKSSWSKISEVLEAILFSGTSYFCS